MHCIYSNKNFEFEPLLSICSKKWPNQLINTPFTLLLLGQLEMLLISNALCWSSRKCNCACALPAEVGKSVLRVKNLVTAQTQLRLYSEQQRAFGISNICYCQYAVKIICATSKLRDITEGWRKQDSSCECNKVVSVFWLFIGDAILCSNFFLFLLFWDVLLCHKNRITLISQLN